MLQADASEFYGIIAASYTRDELKRLYAESFRARGPVLWKVQVLKARKDFKRGLSA